MEHRCGKRSELRLPVKLHLVSGRVIEGHLANISLSGAFVRLDSSLPSLTRVVVEIDDSELRDSHMHLVTGCIVREAADGVGIEWAEFAPAVVTILLSGAAARLRAYANSHIALHARRAPASMRLGDTQHCSHVQSLRGNGANATLGSSLSNTDGK